MYTLRDSNVAQSGTSSSRHPIVGETSAQSGPPSSRSVINVDYSRPDRPCACLSDIKVEVGIMLRRELFPHPGNKPGMRILLISVSRIDTGGERQIPNPRIKSALKVEKWWKCAPFCACNSPFLPNMRIFTVLHTETGIFHLDAGISPPYWFYLGLSTKPDGNNSYFSPKRAETDRRGYLRGKNGVYPGGVPRVCDRGIP